MDTIEINIKTNAANAAEETKSLREQVRDLRKEMESTAVGTEEYEQAIKKLADATHEYKDQQDIIKNSAGDLGTVFANLQSVSSNIVSGFSAISAATQLLGSNSEDLQKSMLKLQQGMALVQGLKGLEGIGKNTKNLITSFKALIVTTKAQAAGNTALAASEKNVAVSTNVASVALKGFKAALASTGIGLIVVAVAALITNLDKIGKLFGTNKESVNQYANANDKLNEILEKQNEQVSLNSRLMEVNGATSLEIIRYKKQEAEAQLALVAAQIQEIKNATLYESMAAKNKAERKAAKKHAEENLEEIKKLEETYKELYNLVKSLSADETVQIAKDKKAEEKAAKDAANKAAEAAKKAAEDSKKSAQQLGKSFNTVLENILSKYENVLRSISNVKNNILNQNTLDEINSFKMIYGVDPDKMSTNLSAAFNTLVNNAFNELKSARDKALKSATSKDEVDAVLKEYEDAVTKLQNIIGQKNVDAISFEDTLRAQTNSSTEALITQAGKISGTYVATFKDLKTLYEQGYINETEYYAGLDKARQNYYDQGEALLKNDVYQTKLSEEDKVRVKQELQIKPLETQQTINDEFIKRDQKMNETILANLENALIQADTAYTGALMNAELKQKNWLKDHPGKGFFSLIFGTTDLKAEQAKLDAQHSAYQEYYNAQAADIQARYDNGLLSQEEYNNAMTSLEADRLAEEESYTRQSSDLKWELHATALNTSAAILNSFAQLTDSLNSLSEAQLSEYKRQLEAGDITQEKYDKLQKESLKKQASLQIATTVMQTCAGIATAWAQAMQLGFVVGPIVAAVQTAALIVNMTAQIASIKSALKSGLAGSTSSSDTPNTSMTLQSTDAYANQVSDDTTADLQTNAQKNTKVYVTSSDISSKQNEDKVSVTTSTF